MSIQLGADLEEGLRAEATKRGVSVEALVREALAGWRQGKAELPQPSAFNPRRQEIAWLKKPDARFLGQWVVIEGNEVIAHASEGKVAYEEARAKGIRSPFLAFVPEPEESPFVGGWID